MRQRRRAFAGAAFLLLFIPCAHGKGTCQFQPLRHQQRDKATIERLEQAWSIAYLHGDTPLERCILAPDFTEILRTGEVKGLADEMGLATKNKGKNVAIPDLPKPTILIHGNVAVAYGTSGPAGRRMKYADYYVWENGSWHAFFAQQTQLETR